MFCSSAQGRLWGARNRTACLGPLARVLLDRHAVVHLVDPQDLRFTAVAAELVILAHDEGLDGLGRADLRTEAAETATRQIEVEVIQHLDLEARLAVPPERDQVIRA